MRFEDRVFAIRPCIHKAEVSGNTVKQGTHKTDKAAMGLGVKTESFLGRAFILHYGAHFCFKQAFYKIKKQITQYNTEGIICDYDKLVMTE